MNKIVFVVIFSSLVILMNSCVGEREFEMPSGEGLPPDVPIEQVLTISTLYSIWWQNTEGEGIYSLDDSYTDMFLEGYVISCDEAGNFFEELYLQDSPDNPHRGIKVLIDSSPLFSRYSVGRRVYIKLEGVSLGLSNGVFSLGVASSTEIEPISELQTNRLIKRDTLVTTIVPKPVPIGAISPELMNIYLRLEDVQFHRSQLKEGAVLTYAGEVTDLYDGERLLEGCLDFGKVVFSTSSFSDFKGVELANGSGHIDGIAMFDYYGERMIFTVNGLSDIHLDNEMRCDPQVVLCEAISNNSELIWLNDFDNLSNTVDLLEEGWSLYNVLEGETSWEFDAFGGNSYLRISGYNSGEPAMESWLISPSIDLEDWEEAELSFDVQVSYDNGADLKVYLSTNFEGDPQVATWEQLDMVISPGPYQGFGEYQSIGPISLSCFDGPVVLAWVYEGSDPYHTTRFHLDTIKISGG